MMIIVRDKNDNEIFSVDDMDMPRIGDIMSYWDGENRPKEYRVIFARYECRKFRGSTTDKESKSSYVFGYVMVESVVEIE